MGNRSHCSPLPRRVGDILSVFCRRPARVCAVF